jgi:hypothetical protein
MRGSATSGRLLAAGVGGVMMLSGLAALAQNGASAPAGFWLVIIGLALVVAAVVERWRYRSESAERAGLPVGPGGGEPTGEALESRFRRTEETFIDPTSGRRMSVWLDSSSGERRYRAED